MSVDTREDSGEFYPGGKVVTSVPQQSTAAITAAIKAIDNRVTELEENGGAPSYDLIDLPAGETQLPDRSMIHITEKNVIEKWNARTAIWDDETGDNITTDYPDVKWVVKEKFDPETETLGEGEEYFMAKSPVAPDKRFMGVRVADAISGERYTFDTPYSVDASGIDETPLANKIIINPIRDIYSSSSWNLPFQEGAPSPISMTLTAEDETTYNATLGERWGLQLYLADDTDASFDISGLKFVDSIPPGMDVDEPYCVFYPNDLLAEPPSPGSVIEGVVELYNWETDESSTFNASITFSDTIPDWVCSYTDKTVSANITLIKQNPDGTESVFETFESSISYYFEQYTEDWGDGPVEYTYKSLSFERVASTSDGFYINVYLYVNSGTDYPESQIDITPPVIGEEIVFDNLDEYQDCVDFAISLGGEATFVEDFSFNPPAPKEGKSRDFLLCVDLTADRDIELEGVTPTEEGLFSLTFGRTLLSVTEPVAGTLYASTKTLPTETV